MTKIDHWSAESTEELSETVKLFRKKFGKGPIFVLADGEMAEAYIADRPIQLSDPVPEDEDGIKYPSWAHYLVTLADDVPQAEAEVEAKEMLAHYGFKDWRQTTVRDFFADLVMGDDD